MLAEPGAEPSWYSGDVVLAAPSRSLFCAVLVIGACRAAPPAAPAPAAASAAPGAAEAARPPPDGPVEVIGLRPPLASLAWMLGHWERDDGGGQGREHWIAAGGVLWGIAFTVKDGRTAFFEVMQIDADQGGAIRLTAIPGGERAVVFPQSASAERSATFANPEHDAPRVIRYSRTADDRLRAELDPGQGAAGASFSFHRAPVPRAPALEAAERAFAAGVAARGLDAWVEAFAPDGVKWNDVPVRGADAIRAAMAPIVGNPDARLVWEPAVSALSPAGDMGFTIGPYRFLRRAPGADFEERGRGTYVSLWSIQPDGVWRVRWDGGHPE